MEWLNEATASLGDVTGLPSDALLWDLKFLTGIHTFMGTLPLRF
jgi:hypothetical protein